MRREQQMNDPIYYNLKWFHFSDDLYRTDSDRLLHDEMWETAYGKIPEFAKILFIDGDTTNCTLMNLSMKLPPAPKHNLMISLPRQTSTTKW